MSRFSTGLLVTLNALLGGIILHDKGYLPVPNIQLPAQVTIPLPVFGEKPVTPAERPIEKGVDLKLIDSFVYYTSQVDPQRVANSKADLVIVNEANKDSKLFTAADVAVMKKSGKVVLAEVSVGIAERYRWYWNPAWDKKKPEFLGEEFIPQQYYVKQWWHPDWLKIGYSIIDKAIEAGYDGVVLDGIDTYIEIGASKDMRDRMADFVIQFSKYAKNKKPGFLIVPKNAELLGVIPEYANAVDAIVKEDLVYASTSNGNSGPKNDNAQIVKSIRDLNEFRKSGAPVFVIEYVSAGLWNDAKARIKANGFIGYSSPGRTPSTIRENVW